MENSWLNADFSGEGLEFTTELLEQSVHDFRRLVDDGWIDRTTREVELGRSETSLGEAWYLLEGLSLLPRMLDALRRGQNPPKPWLIPILGMSAYAVSAAAVLPGAEHLFRKLRQHAAKGDRENFSRFFDRLFEAEAAVYFSTMQGPARAEFEPGPHPDLWVHPRGAGDSARTPIECKRLSPLGPKKQTLRRLRRRLKSAVAQLTQSLPAEDSGIIALRTRPPENLAELEAIDETVRERLDNPRVGFVEIFWVLSETTTGTWLFDAEGRRVRTRKEAYHLIPYRILNPSAARPLSPHDSRADRFAYFGESSLRPPNNGNVRT